LPSKFPPGAADDSIDIIFLFLPAPAGLSGTQARVDEWPGSSDETKALSFVFPINVPITSVAKFLPAAPRPAVSQSLSAGKRCYRATALRIW
jgi:hypothetical protein